MNKLSRMNKQFLRCKGCGQIFTDFSLSKCSCCGGILIVDYSDECLREGSGCLVTGGGDLGIYAFQDLLPHISPSNRVSLKEGHTPYIRGTNLEKETGQSSLWLKDESRNPTGAFKDRALSLCVSMAKELGYQKVVVASSGNGAASTSAYGAKAGLETSVVIPEETPEGKTIHAMVCGAQMNRIPGKFNKSYEFAEHLAETGGFMNLTTTFLSPLGVEGYKTIAYEIYLQSEVLPDYIFIPVGAGPLLYGIYKGFDELVRMGRTAAVPKLAAVQSTGCAPVVRAWEEGKAVAMWENPHGVASAIADPLAGYEDNGDLAVDAVNASNGFAVAVEDQDILEAGKMLARTEGIFVEPSSAAALAGLLKAREKGLIGPDAKAVLILTGSGLKDPLKYMGTEGS